ncbi:TonB-dependent receptor [Enterovibrio sp. ZSDZ35]|uniref:TonB-dependent receptor n=1 Tax=Enterovibrio qingdaonensis TaxID=2899818 RepID=A0ABT5QTP0_9GAMM|nr:TonB-dependent receptor [Enterovibrio sp. ZSDZ35]MDD1784340.1 TonB-dependent receptor [Enterovibrio sp. ZSDZ35]
MYQGRSFNTSPLTLAICAALLSQTAIADDHANAHETVVVTGNPLATTDVTIDTSQLEERQANDLNDIFRTDPEVTVGGGSSVSQKIYVRGLENTLLNVSIDGAVQSGNIYHHQGSISIEPDILQQVEVIAGAGRATDGAGALGGAIRFETKDGEEMLMPGERFGGSVKAGYYSNTEGYKTTVSGYGLITDNVSALATLSYSDLDDYEDGDGEKQDHTGAENKVGYFKVVGNITDSQKLSLSYDSREDEAYRYHRPQWVESKKNSPINQEMDRQTLTAKYELNPEDISWLNLALTAYNTEISLKHIDGPWGDYLGEAKSFGADLRNITSLGKHALIYGVEYRDDEGYLTSPTYGSDKDEGQVFGVYLQGDFYVSDALLLSAGGRFDSYKLDESGGNKFDHDGFSPNVSVNYAITSNLKVYAGYAQALRGAQVREIFKLDGTKSAETRKEETAENTEAGATWVSGGLHLSATAFVTKIDDIVDEESKQLANVGDLETKGFTTRAAYYWDSVSTGISYNQSRPELDGKSLNDDTKGIGTAIGDTWVADVNYQITESIVVGYVGRYVERLTDVADGYDEKAGYAVHDIYSEWTPFANEDLTVSLAVKNLFDKAYRDHASYGIYRNDDGSQSTIAVGTREPGRDIRFNVAYAF